ncbi:MAG: hypothetical protein KAJ98_01555, partial [Spirochaetaceae bacterium]|nr:hypothetical protein [Spirochaetaceae bacterium]
MKKVSVVILETDRVKALRRLRKTGVLHLEIKPVGSGDDLESLSELHSRISSAISKLDNSLKPEQWDGIFDHDKALEAIDDVLRIDGRLKELHGSMVRVSAQEDMLKPYGEFEPADLVILRSKGIDIRLFEGDDAMMDRLKDAGGTVFIMQRKKKKSIFAAVFTGDAPDEAAGISIELPEYGIIELASIQEEILAEIAQLGNELAEHSIRKPILEHFLATLEQNLEFEALATGMDREGELTWVTGFVPEGEISQVRELSSAEGWGLLIRDPDPDDPIPTLLKNGPKIRIIQPVFDFLGTLPGYREYDISLYFLAYFSIFFAMIVGDAGYGVLFFLMAMILAIKSLKKAGTVPDMLRLLFVLSLATIAWGTITGNWFGSQSIAALTPMRSLTIPSIATYPELFPEVEADPQKAVMWLCFLLGLTQLTLANVMNFIRDFP